MRSFIGVLLLLKSLARAIGRSGKTMSCKAVADLGKKIRRG
jgi:hypothetical protein